MFKRYAKMAKAFTGLGLAIKAAGIGVLLDAFQLFKDVMMSNQKVLDLFQTFACNCQIHFTAGVGACT